MRISKREMIRKLHMELERQGIACGLNIKQLERIVDTYITLIEAALIDGWSYRLGYIGTLKVARRKGSRVRIPRTNQFVDVPSKYYCKLLNGRVFSVFLNAPDSVS